MFTYTLVGFDGENDAFIFDLGFAVPTVGPCAGVRTPGRGRQSGALSEARVARFRPQAGSGAGSRPPFRARWA